MLKSSALTLALGWAVAWTTFTQHARAQEAPKVSEAATAAAAKLRDNPDDAQSLVTYINESLRGAMGAMEKEPQAALKAIDELESFLNGLQGGDRTVRSLVGRGRDAAQSVRRHIQLKSMSLEDIVKRLNDNPADQKSLEDYVQKVSMEIDSLTRAEPEEAVKKQAEARTLLSALREKAEGGIRSNLAEAIESLGEFDQAIEAGRKLAAIVGKPAAPLKVEAWVNGSPMTEQDLSGKVVLLDFWAVWCGPCIAGFPHLREWQEKYGDKGLVIIGLTQYYNFKWDEASKSPERADGPVPPAGERDMLAKFAKSHELKHRLAIMSDDSMAEYYQVSGIPHMVVIDQQGKVRLMRVGTSEENTQAISAMLEKLLTK